MMLMSMLFIFAVSCQEEDVLSTGSLQVNITDEGGETRALPAFTTEMTGLFDISVYSQPDSKLIHQSTCAEINAGNLLLKPGEYTVQAIFGTNPDIALDAPYYESQVQPITVVAGKAQTVDLHCKVLNAVAAFEFTNGDELQKLVRDLGVEAVVPTGTATWKFGDSANFYFKADQSIAFYLTGMWVETNQPYRKKLGEVDAVKAGYLYKYTLTVESGAMDGVIFDIRVEDESKPVSVTETIPQDYLPSPKITASGFDSNNQLVFTETENNVAATVTYTAARPLQDMEFTVDFNDPRYKILNGTYTLSTLAPWQRDKFAELGFQIPDGSQTSGSWIVQTDSLMTVDSGADTENTLAVRVKSTGRWTPLQTYTIRTKYPVFTIKALPEQMWSREFTIEEPQVTTGVAANLMKKLVFQYTSDNGNTWQNLNAVRTQKFAEHPKDKKYQVRAIYRDKFYTNEVDVELETPVQMPNSNMDSWNAENYKSGRYCFYPWSSDKSDKFWDTNNLFTTRHRNNASVNVYNYNGYHAVSYVEGRGGTGLAAELHTTVNGRGNMVGTVRDYNKKPAQLFAGTSTLTMGTSGFFNDSNGGKDVLTLDTEVYWSNRPTALKFWYMYAPYKSDIWCVDIKLLDASKKEIISKHFESGAAQSAWTEQIVSLDYVDNQVYAKCKYICVMFQSSIYTGNQLPYNGSKTTAVYYLLDGNGNLVRHEYSDVWLGSTLTIDDISLVYDK